jgi:predicted short-subunit dehydrogenase-like oxidoreductase (DUF2520 family)
MRKVSIVGVGRMGGALAIALARKGYEIKNLFGRNREAVERIYERLESKPKILSDEEFSAVSSEIILITTQDFEIENVAAVLAAKLQNKPHKPFVFHASGSLSSDVLRPLKEIGCRVGSIHPLVSVSDAVFGAERFAGAFFCVEGEPEAVETAEKIVSELGGKSFTVETKFKALYHAAAVVASGHFVALIDVALEIFSKCGVEKNKAREILLPLVESTIENLEKQTTAQALTGTFARADVETFERHLEALGANVSVEARCVYLQLAERSTHLAETRGANAEKISEIQKRISLAKKNLKC